MASARETRFSATGALPTAALQQTMARACDRILHVRRAAAFLGSFILFVPLIGLLGNRCAQAPCCSPGFCPLPTGHTHHQPSGQKPACDHAPATPANCELKAGCGQMNRDGILAPLPPVVLAAAAELPAPEFDCSQIFSLTQMTSPGFRSVPSPPPRN